MSADAGFRALPHTADEGFEAWGPTFADACGQAALALYAVMGRPETLTAGEEFARAATGVDRGDALVRLLTGLLAAFEIEGHFATSVAEATAETGAAGPAVALRLRGGRVDRSRERHLTEVKAVTYHGLRVEDAPGRVTVRVYLDL